MYSLCMSVSVCAQANMHMFHLFNVLLNHDGMHEFDYQQGLQSLSEMCAKQNIRRNPVYCSWSKNKPPPFFIFAFSCFYAYFRIDYVKLQLGLPCRIRKEVQLGPCRGQNQKNRRGGGICASRAKHKIKYIYFDIDIPIFLDLNIRVLGLSCVLFVDSRTLKKNVFILSIYSVYVGLKACRALI